MNATSRNGISPGSQKKVLVKKESFFLVSWVFVGIFYLGISTVRTDFNNFFWIVF